MAWTAQSASRMSILEPSLTTVSTHQAVALALADLAVAEDNARNQTFKAAWPKDAARPIGEAASVAKLSSTEAAVIATRVATRAIGGAGFIEEGPVARVYPDATILEIAEGTSEIQRLVIARSLSLPAG